MNNEQLAIVVQRCRMGEREAQKLLYTHFYNYALTICTRYAKDIEEAREMLNDAFLKVFTRLEKYNGELSFKGWLNKIIINTAIDYFRKNQIHPLTVDIIHAQHYEISEDAIQSLALEELTQIVQQLPPSYRLVFNLHVMEGLNHPEIATMLNISVGASKSNLAKARMRLKTIIQSLNEKKIKHA